MKLKPCYSENEEIIEIGVDEVGRGPMFGRVYCAAVILPQRKDFKYKLIKDSKKFTSKKRIKEVANYIKENCIAYSIAYEDEDIIDKHNILNATHMAMHKAIKNIIDQKINNNQNLMILVDGNNFKPLTYFDNKSETIKEIDAVCIKGGDNLYSSIAAASILAKVERDNYIDELCKEYPKLDELYDLSKNKGYGTTKHMQGIREYGITNWHRKSFGICREANVIDV